MIIALIITSISIPFVYLISFNGNIEVRRSITIQKGQKKVFDKVRDLTSWPDWTPWLLHEHNAKLAFSDQPNQEHAWYSWDDKHIGAGKIFHDKFTGTEKIEQHIEFQRPFKSTSQIWWEFEEIDANTTRVHWNMQSQMPFFARFMAQKMADLIGKDYELGLLQLRAELDNRAEKPRLYFDGGSIELPKQNALTIPFSGDLATMQKAMRNGYPKLMNYVSENHVETSGYPLCAYYKVDPQRPYFSGDLAIPTSSEVETDEFTVKSIPGGKFYKIELHGSYDFLPLAWSQAYSHLYIRKIKPQPKLPALEIYANNPETVSSNNELITYLYIPIK